MPLIPFYAAFFLFAFDQGQHISNFWIALLSISPIQSNQQICRKPIKLTYNTEKSCWSREKGRIGLHLRFLTNIEGAELIFSENQWVYNREDL